MYMCVRNVLGFHHMILIFILANMFHGVIKTCLNLLAWIFFVSSKVKFFLFIYLAVKVVRINLCANFA